jgi:hypothetical protein
MDVLSGPFSRLFQGLSFHLLLTGYSTLVFTINNPHIINVFYETLEELEA